jgi:hypothetical protein
MNFAYLDHASIIETLVRPPREPIPVEPCELDANWKKFEKELGEFKMKYTKVRAQLTIASAKLREKREEIDVMKMMMESVASEGLKDRISGMLADYEEEEKVGELTHKCSVLSGEVEAMKRVLLDTNVERYGKFTCFICMDKLVDLFIEPCGHVICDACWMRTARKDICPGCRAPTQGVKKIFTMN